MKPNFEDLSCDMIFGQMPSPPAEDEAFQQPCFKKQCKTIVKRINCQVLYILHISHKWLCLIGSVAQSDEGVPCHRLPNVLTVKAEETTQSWIWELLILFSVILLSVSGDDLQHFCISSYSMIFESDIEPNSFGCQSKLMHTLVLNPVFSCSNGSYEQSYWLWVRFIEVWMYKGFFHSGQTGGWLYVVRRFLLFSGLRVRYVAFPSPQMVQLCSAYSNLVCLALRCARSHQVLFGVPELA